MRYYIADLHFYHRAMNEKMDQRGFSTVEEMNEYMVEQWNKKVRKNDEVVILGDFSFGTAEETNQIMARLHGRLYLIVGNHDHVLKHRKMDLSRFVWVKEYAEMSDGGRKVVLCHYPIMCYNGQYRLKPDGSPATYMLYGHVHDTMDQQLLVQFQKQTRTARAVTADGTKRPIPCNMINCFCMYSDYQPLTLEEWVAFAEKRWYTDQG